MLAKKSISLITVMIILTVSALQENVPIKFPKNYRKRLGVTLNYLELESNQTNRIDLLKHFLMVNMYSNLDKIELSRTLNIHFNQPKNIIKFDKKKMFNCSVKSEICRTEYNFVEFKSIYVDKKAVPICPSEFAKHQRLDIYPFERNVAICCCIQCMVLYDVNMPFNGCHPHFELMPALKMNKTKTGKEIWKFYLEQVPSACYCKRNYNEN